MLHEINQCKILLNLNDSGQCEGSVRNSLVSLVQALLKHKRFYLSFKCDGFVVVNIKHTQTVLNNISILAAEDQ